MEWIEINHPEYFVLLSEMVKRKQLEILSGAFYDPILPIISNADKLGQIEKSTTFIRKHFGKKPRGCWITEMAWDPSLAYTLKSSGMEYTILNDDQLSCTGINEENMYSPYITEEQGKTISVFINLKKLTELLERSSLSELINEINLIRERRSNSLIVIAASSKAIGKNGFEQFEEFLKYLRNNRKRLILQSPTMYLRGKLPEKRIYIPETQCNKSEYFSRNYLSQNEDVNLLCSRMIHTTILVNQLRGDKYKKRAARNELWKGQCNSVYWDSYKGGIYNNRLRKAAYRAFLETEKIIRADSEFIPSVLTVDFDMDGKKEFLYQGKVINAYVHQKSGSVIELDYIPSSWNYLDTVNRKQESFDKTGSLNAKYSAKAFIDRFLPQEEGMDNFKSGKAIEVGDFSASNYTVADINTGKQSIQFRKTGYIFLKGNENAFRIEKKYTFRQNTIYISYILSNLSEKELSFKFGVELNLSLTLNKIADYKVSVINSGNMEELDVSKPLERKGMQSFSIADTYNNTLILVNPSAMSGFWTYPVYYNNMYQYTFFMPYWEMNLKSGEIVKCYLSVKLKRF